MALNINQQTLLSSANAEAIAHDNDGLRAPEPNETGPRAPYDIEKWLLTIEAHCTVIADDPLTKMQSETLNCIRWNCADIRHAFALRG